MAKKSCILVRPEIMGVEVATGRVAAKALAMGTHSSCAFSRVVLQ